MIALHAPDVHAVSVHGLAGQPLAVGVVLLVSGAWLWHHEHHFQRFTLWLFTAGAACLTVAVPGFLGALAGEVTTGPGMTALFVSAVVIGITWYLVAVRSVKKSRLAGMLQHIPGAGKALAITGGAAPRRNRYRRIGSVMVALSAGVLFVLVYGSWRLMLRSASVSAGGAAKALLESSHRVSTGQAAAAVPPGHRAGYLIAFAVILAVAGLVMRSHERRKHGGGDRGRQQQRPGTPIPGIQGGRP